MLPLAIQAATGTAAAAAAVVALPPPLRLVLPPLLLLPSRYRRRRGCRLPHQLRLLLLLLLLLPGVWLCLGVLGGSRLACPAARSPPLHRLRAATAPAGIVVCILTTLIATDLKPARVVAEIESTLKVQLIVSTLVMTPVSHG